MTKVEKYTQEAINIANDNSHGYSQANRWGTPDYDCSSLVIQVVENAGIPVKSNGATYTGNMRAVFQSCGFLNVTTQCGLGSGYGMKRGDILLNDESHTAIYIGDGKVVHARSSEGNSQSGDQSGNEIRCQSYWNFPWNCVLRFPEIETSENTEETEAEEKKVIENESEISITPDISTNNKNYPTIIQYGDEGEEVKEIQQKLNFMGYSCGVIDGIFGFQTDAAVRKFQENKGLLVDGSAGPDTQKALESYYSALSSEIQAEKIEINKNSIVIGVTVNFTGTNHYRSSTSKQEFECLPGKATVEKIDRGGEHPYYLIAIKDKGSTVHGWVDEQYVRI